MTPRLRAGLLVCLAPLAVWAATLVPLGGAAYGYSGGPPPTTTCPPSSTTNPAGHCPPGRNGGGGGGGHGHAAAAAAQSGGSGSSSATHGPGNRVNGAGAATQVEAANPPASGVSNQGATILRDAPVQGSRVPVTHHDLVELVILAIALAAGAALGARRWLMRRRRQFA